MSYAKHSTYSLSTITYQLISGFTLMETMIAVTIVGLLTVGATASYGNYNKGQKLKQTALTLKNDLRQAQSKATSAEFPIGCDSPYSGYIVTFISGIPATYTITADCASDVIVSQVSLPAGINVSSGVVRFLSLGQLDTSDQTITVSQDTRNCTLTVLKNGTVEDDGCTP